MKNRLIELNDKRVALMQECRVFEKKVIKPGQTALPYEVWVTVSSEGTGYAPKRVGIVSVEKMEPFRYPYYLYMDTDGNEYLSEDLSEDAHWDVLNAYMESV